MSIPHLATGEPTVTVDDIHVLAKANNFAIEPGSSNEEALLLFGNSFDAICKTVDDLPEHFDPRLQPEPLKSPGRQYERPLQGNNPLNAWMHKTHLVSSDPNATNGPLVGKTIVLKDNISVAGLPLGLGCNPSILKNGQHPVSPIDATVVKRILRAGGTIKGTGTCENLSLFPLSFTSAAGNVHNAWLPGYATGGSSSGCAALVSINAVSRAQTQGKVGQWELGDGADMAIGGDQGGSIRLPAAYSGIYGIKPTHGLVPYTGIAGLSPMIDHTGPMCQSIDDCALLLGVIAGYDGLDIRMTPEAPLPGAVQDYHKLLQDWIKAQESAGSWNAKSAASSLRVGVLLESFDTPALDPHVRATVEAAAEQFRSLGAKVSNVSVPSHKHGALLWTVAPRPLLPHFLSNKAPDLLGYPMPHLDPLPVDQNYFDVLANRNPATVNALLNTTHMEQKYGPGLARKAMMHVHELRRAYDEALEQVDVLLTPVNMTVGPKFPSDSVSGAENLNGNSKRLLDIMEPAVSSTLNTSPFNLTGHPAMSIPVGRGKAKESDAKLPIGMQLIGKRFDEMSIFKAAKAWEMGGSWLDTL